MVVTALSGRERRQLRALGHALDPVIAIGQQGLTDALLNETRKALDAHELIKVRLGTNSELERKDVFQELADACEASLVQVIGRIGLLYKPQADPEKRKIEGQLKAITGKRGARSKEP